MEVSTRKSNKDEQALLHTLHDDTDKHGIWTKSKLFFLVLASFAIGIFVAHLLQKDVPARRQLSLVVAEQQVGEGTTVQHNTNEIDRLKLEWMKLNIVFADPTSDVAKYLEDDVFQHLDLDHDGVLSAEERKRFLQSSVLQTFADFDEQKMEEVKNNMQYPVIKITSDMDDQQIKKICDMANWLKDKDMGELFDEMFEKNPEILIETALKIVDDYINTQEHKNIDFDEFHSFLDKSEHEVAFSTEFQMPEECNQIAIPTRRRTFGGIVAAIGIVVYFGTIPFVAAGAVAGNQIDCWIPDPPKNRPKKEPCRGPSCGGKRRIRRNLIESSSTDSRRRRLADCKDGASGRIFSEVANTMVGSVTGDDNDKRKEELGRRFLNKKN